MHLFTKQKNIPSNKGIIQLLIIIVLSVVILSLLGVSIGSLINNKTLKENFAFLINGLLWLWHNYLQAQVITIWHFIRGLFGK